MKLKAKNNAGKAVDLNVDKAVLSEYTPDQLADFVKDNDLSEESAQELREKLGAKESVSIGVQAAQDAGLVSNNPGPGAAAPEAGQPSGKKK